MTASVVGTISRLGYLQALPGLDELPAPAMAVVAEMVRECHYPRRARLAEPRRPSAVAHVVVDGELVLDLPGGKRKWLSAGQHVGWWTVLADDAIDFELSTRRGALTLAIDREALLDIAEHSSHGFEVLLGLARSIAARLASHAASATVLRPDRGHEHAARAAGDERALGTVERILHLRHLPIFRGVNLDVISQLADGFELVPVRAGDELLPQPARKDAPARPLQLLRGRVEWTTGGDAAMSIEAPAMIGLPHALAREPLPGTLRARTDGLALKVDLDLLLDLAEDNSDLALGLVTGLAARLREETGSR
jgi:CRP-like cAMP-binding protein